MAKTRDEVQKLIDENRPLMEVCSKVYSDLQRARRAADVWNWIADHAEAINDAKHGLSFGTMQDMALTDMFMSVGRAFDEHKHGAPNCVKRIISMLPAAHLIDRSALAAYLEVAGDPAFDRLDEEAFKAKAIRRIENTQRTARNSKI